MSYLVHRLNAQQQQLPAAGNAHDRNIGSAMGAALTNESNLAVQLKKLQHEKLELQKEQ